MSGLTAVGAGFARRRPRGDRGAVAALLVILLGVGSLLTCGALVVDVGGAYAERAQLQNGADSAALAVAAGCARSAATCSASTLATGRAGAEANANANDGTSTVTLVCGNDGRGLLPVCPPPTGDPGSCVGTPVAGTRYAEVHTSTRTTSGSNLLPPAFGRAVLGPGYTGISQTLCARAGFGGPVGGTGLALTLSYCEWLRAVGGNATSPAYAAPPPAVPAASAERVIAFHGTGNSGTCTAGPSGFDVPGDFGSTNDPTNTCSTAFNFDATRGTTTYGASPGSSLSGACQTALTASARNRSVVFMPVYVRVSGTGNNGTYTLWSMAAFVVTGYYWPSFSARSWLTGKQPCSGSTRCISGYFTTAPLPGAVLGAGNGAGASATQLVP